MLDMVIIGDFNLDEAKRYCSAGTSSEIFLKEYIFKKFAPQHAKLHMNKPKSSSKCGLGELNYCALGCKI